MNKFFALIIFILVGLFFSDATQSYFSQDDFFHLRVVMDKQWSDILGFFFSLQKEYAFYRPLSRETFNLVMYNIFHLNPLPFHIVNLLLIILNGVLVWKISQKILKNQLASWLAVVLYLFNSIHSIEIYYLASVQTLLATMFLLISVLFYLSSSTTKNYFLSLLFFILGLLSHEISIVFIGIIFFLEVIVVKRQIWNKKLIIRLLPFGAIGLFYLINTSLFNRLPEQQVYQPVFSIKSIINILSWYTLWVMNIPEFIIDFIGPKLAINPNLLKWYGSFLKIVVPLLMLAGLSLGYLLINLRKKIIRDKTLFFLIAAYITSLSPFLFFPQHKSSYYLTFASCWFALLLALVLSWAWESKKTSKILVLVVVASFIIISYQTTKLNKLTYWAAKRAVAAQSLLASVQQSYPRVDRGAVFYINNDPAYPLIAKEWGSSSKQAYYILSGSDAFKLIFKDPSIEVYFEENKPLPSTVDRKKVIIYTAKFPY